MRERKILDPIVTAPLITELEMDVRVRLRLDVTRLLHEGRVDPESGEPSPEELQGFVLATVERHLQAQPHVLSARVTWLDLEFVVRCDW